MGVGVRGTHAQTPQQELSVMASSIVPAACKPADASDDFTLLVEELMADEQLSRHEASANALDLLDELTAYALIWNFDATIAGNPDALPKMDCSRCVSAVLPLDLLTSRELNGVVSTVGGAARSSE
jgi:hypothetical protein